MHISASATLGERVRAIRIDKGTTVEALARGAEVSVRTVVNIEQDRTRPRVDIVQRIADALGVPVADLFAPQSEAEAS